MSYSIVCLVFIGIHDSSTSLSHVPEERGFVDYTVMLEFSKLKTPPLDTAAILSLNTQLNVLTIAFPKQATSPPSVVPIASLIENDHGHIIGIES